MKTRIFLLASAIVLIAFSVNAQAPDANRVKILPGERPGMMKVLYAMGTNDPLIVRFSQDNEILASDKIKGPYSKGVIRRYDVRQISSSDFYVQVTSETMNLTYRVVPSADKKSFTPYLEKAEYKNELVAALK